MDRSRTRRTHMSPISWLCISLLATALAQLAFKSFFSARRGLLLATAIALFLVVPYTTYNALKGLPLATVYVATAATQLLVVVLSLVVLGERYTSRQYAGLGLVLVGIVIFNLP